MSEPNHARLLDPRWHMIADAARQFYDALEPADQIAGMNIVVVSADGNTMNYAVVAGETELHRHLIVNPDAVEQAMRESAIDLTPRQVPHERPPLCDLHLRAAGRICGAQQAMRGLPVDRPVLRLLRPVRAALLEAQPRRAATQGRRPAQRHVRAQAHH